MHSMPPWCSARIAVRMPDLQWVLGLYECRPQNQVVAVQAYTTRSMCTPRGDPNLSNFLQRQPLQAGFLERARALGLLTRSPLPSYDTSAPQVRSWSTLRQAGFRSRHHIWRRKNTWLSNASISWESLRRFGHFCQFYRFIWALQTGDALNCCTAQNNSSRYVQQVSLVWTNWSCNEPLREFCL